MRRAAAAVLALLVAGVATAADYPPATDPGKGPHRPPRGGTIRVCGKGCRYHRIQAAIDAAGRGTTIRVARGTYREGLHVLGSARDGVRLMGAGVVLDGGSVRAPDGVLVRGADGVVVSGFRARRFRRNGFFVANADGYRLTRLVAERSGAHGLYAVDSKGGEMSDSQAYYHSVAGFAVEGTAVQTRPKRTALRGLVAWGNAAGVAGLDSRYLTITASRLFDNSAGLVLDGVEDATVADNDVFWNNWNLHAGAPFTPAPGGYPAGAGILVLGGRDADAEGNRVWGNWLVGYGQTGAAEDDVVHGNVFGLASGADPNGRDLLYDGSGAGNCFDANAIGSGGTVPSGGSTLAPCPHSGPNGADQSARDEYLTWSTDPTHEAHWRRGTHVPIAGITPLEHWTAAYPPPPRVGR